MHRFNFKRDQGRKAQNRIVVFAYKVTPSYVIHLFVKGDDENESKEDWLDLKENNVKLML